MVEDLEQGVADMVVVAKASLLCVDTSPMLMEKFIATLKRRAHCTAPIEDMLDNSVVSCWGTNLVGIKPLKYP